MPRGEFTVEIETRATADGSVDVLRVALLRTTRRLFEGHVLVPAALWAGRPDRAASKAAE